MKVVVFNKSECAFAEEHAKLVKRDCEVSLQQEWRKAEKFTPEIIEYVKNRPFWKISLQTHKFMEIP